ncbi:MAG TPA: pectinesterase family protein [Phnomibacter sp.]|nr:pectinesterase family protein [Phnomibacter sp.]
MKRFAFIVCLLVICSAAIAQADKNREMLVVAKDGTGRYTTVQQALDALPQHSATPVTIFVKKGVYYEKLLIDTFKQYVKLVGEDKFNTIISYNDHAGKKSPTGETINTRTSWSVRILANDFTAENISFRNDAGFTAGQAVAVETIGDKLVFRNCRFLGFQDVLFTSSARSRQYFEDCYIEGTTDFIFGSATVWFERCELHSKKDSHVTAASTPKENTFGYVFNQCTLTADTSVHKVTLGRPWQPYAKVVYMHCQIGAHIKPEGWSDWNNAENQKTAFYAEYRNSGPGAATAQRVPWSKQLSKKQAKEYRLKKVFKDWNPTL